MKPIFTIVIPAFNCRATIELLLRCLEVQNFPREQFECVIVDDGSKDGTSAFLQRYQRKINMRPIAHPKNMGRAQARNTGCAHAKGDFLVFLDADMLPEPNWLAAYAVAIAQNPGVDVFSGGRYHIHLGANPDQRPQVLAQKMGTSPSELFINGISDHFDYLRLNAPVGMYPGYAMAKIETQLPDVCKQYPENVLCAYSLITSNVAVRRSLFEKTSGFDTSIRRTEDTDLGVRLWEMGARFDFAQDAIAYHMYHAGESDRANILIERQAFFYRHPYMMIILLTLWFAYHDQLNPTLPSPVFDSLLSLIAAGPSVLDIDVRQEFYKVYRQSNWVECICDRDFMLSYYCEHSGISREEMDAYLDKAIERGMVVYRRNNRFYFDFYHTTNWLCKSSTYQQYELEHKRYSWIRNWIPTPPTAPAIPLIGSEKMDGDLNRQPLSFRYRGIYEINIDRKALAGISLEATINIPLPAKHACQSDIQIFGVEPENLLDYADPERTMISNFPLERALGENVEITVRYEFEATLREYLLAQEEGQALQGVNNSHYLKPSYPATQLPKAEALLRKILVRPERDSFAIAHTIYTWILNNRLYLLSFLPDYLIMETGFGPCAHQARLFVNLCRLMRIPAREQCGAVFEWSLGPETPHRRVAIGHSYSTLTHTWAEFYTPQHGWIPVEFSARDFSRQTLTESNVESEDLRDQMIRETDRYRSYYFGNIDPFRIYASEQASHVPTYPLIKSKLPQDALKMLLFHTQHRMVCDIAEAAEFSDLRAALQIVRDRSRPRVVATSQDNDPDALPRLTVANTSRRLVITSVGSTGDVQPLLGLADELRSTGHELVFALPDMYRKRIERLGFQFAEIGAGTGVNAWHEVFTRQAKITNPTEQTRCFVEAVIPWMPQMFQELRDICSGADALISPPFQSAARMVHDVTGIPFISVHFSPFGSDRGRAIRDVSASLINQVRQDVGLFPLDDPYGADGASPQLALYAASRHIFRPPLGWPSHYHLTGYWFFDETDWQPDAKLAEFMDAGDPPVVITFGSMPSDDSAALTNLMVTALEQIGCRAIIQHGGGGLALARALPPTIHAIDFVPHTWLFKRAACVVHHGGAGTTAAAFRAGVPTVVVPHLLDQPIWAEYARALGCSAATIPYAQLTAERLRAAIVSTLSNTRLARAASRLGEQIRAESGAKIAAKLIEKEFMTLEGVQ